MRKRPLFGGRHVLGHPVVSGVDLTLTPLGQLIGVRPIVVCALSDQPLIDEGIEVWIETAMVDLLAVVLIQLGFDFEAARQGRQSRTVRRVETRSNHP